MEINRFYTFPGGVFPSHRKSATRNKPIRPLDSLPERVVRAHAVGRSALYACGPPGDTVVRAS